jgi:hypothetical protein
MDFLNPFGKPSLQLLSPRTRRHKMNAEAYLAQNNRIHDDLSFMRAKPINHPPHGLRFGGFAQDVGIDEVFQSVSVDSDWIGTKYPFAGQASSQSTMP